MFIMRLISVEVRHFKNIIDSGKVEVDPHVTCLVGKNESGKTAFLQAVHRLLPARGKFKFSIPDHYPAWLEKRHRMRGNDLEQEEVVNATFALERNELSEVEERFGSSTLKNPSKITLSKKYNNGLVYGIETSEPDFVSFLINSLTWARGTKTRANGIKSIQELRAYARELQHDEEEEKVQTGAAAEALLADLVGDGNDLNAAVWEIIEPRVPRFLYFGEYSTLPYSVDITRILTASPDRLNEQELTARALLMLAGAEEDYLTNAEYERRKRELENVANAITTDVLKYWSQNPELRVMPDITQKTITDNRGQHSVLDELKIRIWDNRHQLSLPFDEHSTGFRWFFSFLAAFSEYEYSHDPVVLLLDEPALGLHGRAQADFLRFIEERLAPNHQVLYTTHSPFMVQPGKLERVRVVEDKSQDLGCIITSDFAATDPDTLFPLQGALGYDLAQHLFISPHNLVVEGIADFTYFQVMSDYFKEIGDRESLHEKWSIVPVGGADLVPTFVALLGGQLDLTVVVDAKKGGHQKLNRLVDQRLLDDKRLITIGHITGQRAADVEDLFSVGDYLTLFNGAFGAAISEGDLCGNDPIVRRIARHCGKDRLDHGRPADYFLRSRDEILPSLSVETLDNFERLFTKTNATMPKLIQSLSYKSLYLTLHSHRARISKFNGGEVLG